MEPLDLTAPVSDVRNVALKGEHGAMLFAFLQQGLYEAHTMVLPDGRGKWTLKFVQSCLKYMFCCTPAMEIVTRCPKGNLPAKALAKAVHGTYCFTNASGWVRNGRPIPADVYSWTIQDWMRLSPDLVNCGKWFHDRLESEFKRHGKTDDNHPDDEIHDRYVGAAVEMCFGGQPDKAVILYNRWAVMAGYLPASIMIRDPLYIDIGTAVLRISNGDFSVPYIRERPKTSSG